MTRGASDCTVPARELSFVNVHTEKYSVELQNCPREIEPLRGTEPWFSLTHFSSVKGLAWITRPEMLATGAQDGVIRLWSVEPESSKEGTLRLQVDAGGQVTRKPGLKEATD